mgnify:CR=1 FL=1
MPLYDFEALDGNGRGHVVRMTMPARHEDGAPAGDDYDRTPYA